MDDCLFCKIVSKEIPSTPVYEDERLYAFLDINPVNPGHVLITPKRHSTNLMDAPEEDVGSIIKLAKKIAQALTKGGAAGINLEMNNGSVAGQVIPHTHLHVVPRTVDDGLKHWPGKEYAPGEAETVAERIRQDLG
ncbi:MAG: HIT family protein [Patescibacteria group bacterium]|nr:HIT family protein [Patescibacteria group bacterium]